MVRSWLNRASAEWRGLARASSTSPDEPPVPATLPVGRRRPSRPFSPGWTGATAGGLVRCFLNQGGAIDTPESARISSTLTD